MNNIIVTKQSKHVVNLPKFKNVLPVARQVIHLLKKDTGYIRSRYVSEIIIIVNNPNECKCET